MLAHLVRFSIRFYGIVIVIALLILIYGSYRFANTGLDVFPEFSPKQIIIQTESPGFSAEQVEILVTQPIELSLSGLMGLQSTRSESMQGLSIVTAIFNEDSDIYRNRQLITERLSSIATQLPEGVHPRLSKYSIQIVNIYNIQYLEKYILIKRRHIVPNQLSNFSHLLNNQSLTNMWKD